MASTTLSASLTGASSMHQRHLRLVDARESAQIQAARKLQWDAMQAGYRKPVRLTKRGRRLVAAVVLVPLTALLWLVSGHGVAAMGTAPVTKTVVVQPGQSLWDLAVTAAPGADPRETVYEIKQMNHFSSSDVIPGQAVVVPTGR